MRPPSRIGRRGNIGSIDAVQQTHEQRHQQVDHDGEHEAVGVECVQAFRSGSRERFRRGRCGEQIDRIPDASGLTTP